MPTSTRGREPEVDEEFIGALYRGGELLAAGNVVEAREHLERARRLEPKNEKAQNLLGLTYFKLGLLDQAADVYERLVDENPADATLRVNLGLVFLKTNNLERCIKEFETATDLEPTHKKAHNYLGLALAQQGDYARAKEHFELSGSEQMAQRMAKAMAAHSSSGSGVRRGAQTVVLGEPPPPPPASAPESPRPSTPIVVGQELASAPESQPLASEPAAVDQTVRTPEAGPTAEPQTTLVAASDDEAIEVMSDEEVPSDVYVAAEDVGGSSPTVEAEAPSAPPPTLDDDWGAQLRQDGAMALAPASDDLRFAEDEGPSEAALRARSADELPMVDAEVEPASAEHQADEPHQQPPVAHAETSVAVNEAGWSQAGVSEAGVSEAGVSEAGVSEAGVSEAVAHTLEPLSGELEPMAQPALEPLPGDSTASAELAASSELPPAEEAAVPFEPPAEVNAAPAWLTLEAAEAAQAEVPAVSADDASWVSGTEPLAASGAEMVDAEPPAQLDESPAETSAPPLETAEAGQFSMIDGGSFEASAQANTAIVEGSWDGAAGAAADANDDDAELIELWRRRRATREASRVATPIVEPEPTAEPERLAPPVPDEVPEPTWRSGADAASPMHDQAAGAPGFVSSDTQPAWSIGSWPVESSQTVLTAPEQVTPEPAPTPSEPEPTPSEPEAAEGAQPVDWANVPPDDASWATGPQPIDGTPGEPRWATEQIEGVYPTPLPQPELDVPEMSAAAPTDDASAESPSVEPPVDHSELEAAVTAPSFTSSASRLEMPAPVASPSAPSAPAAYSPMTAQRLIDLGASGSWVQEPSAGPFHLSADGLAVTVAGEMLLRMDGLVAVMGGLSVTAEPRRNRGRPTAEPFGAGASQVQRVKGSGVVYLEPGSKRFHALDLTDQNGVSLDDDGAYLLEDVVFAFEEPIFFENGRLSSDGLGLDLVHLKGTGRVLLQLEGGLRAMPIPLGAPMMVPLQRVVGWFGRVTPRLTGFGGRGAVELTGEGYALLRH